jgi:hypothetical protein
MYIYFEQLFDLLHNRDINIIIMTVYISCFAAAIALRIVACMHFRSLLLRFRLDIKEIRTKDDIKKLRFGLLRRVIADYIRMAEKNANRIPTAALTERAVAGLSMAGWRYTGIMPFTEALENGLVLVGLVLALLFTDFTVVFGILAVGGFLLTRLAYAFFDFRSARNSLNDELLIYIEREIGPLYPIETGLAAAFPKRELKEAMEKIGAMMAEAAEKRLTDINAMMVKPLEDWNKTLVSAANVQTQINEASKKLQEAVNTLAAPMKDQTQVLSQFAAEQNTLLKHTKLVEQNQRAMEAAYQNYEASLQSLVQSLGDGLGAYMKMHGQSAAQAVNDALSTNIEKIMNLLANQGEPR